MTVPPCAPLRIHWKRENRPPDVGNHPRRAFELSNLRSSQGQSSSASCRFTSWLRGVVPSRLINSSLQRSGLPGAVHHEEHRGGAHRPASAASESTTASPNTGSSIASSSNESANDDGVKSDSPNTMSDGRDGSSTTSGSNKASGQSSQYNGPQLAEPCVGDALSHILEPCGHRVLTRDVQPCGKNCKGSDSKFVNSKTKAKFACAICISRYVQEHHAEKRALFLPSLDKLEEMLGGFEPGWKDQRIARMERIWKNDALEEQAALEKLGRHCAAITIDPEEEALVTTETSKPVAPSPEAPVVLSHCAKKQPDRLRVPIARESSKRSQLPTPSLSKRGQGNFVESRGAKKKTSRIPVGPRLRCM